MAKRRTVVTVRWAHSKTMGWWEVRDGGTSLSVLLDTYPTRRMAIQKAAHYCREYHADGDLLELMVYNKSNGRISERRSYGKDPRKSVG